MQIIEQNVLNSFRLAKSDIIKLQNDIIRLNQNQTRLVEIVKELKTNELHLVNRIRRLGVKNSQLLAYKQNVIKKKVAAKKKDIVATKGGKKFHSSKCPYAKNIKPKNKVKFASKTKALNDGLKACDCLK